MSQLPIDQPEAGNDVISSDGEKVGTIAAIGDGYLLVEKGFFFVTDYRIPADAIASYNTVEHTVHLNVTKDDALNSGWEVEELTDDEYYHEAEMGTYDSPLDGEGNTVMTGAATTPSLPIVQEDDEEPREGTA